ncbi:PLAT/LH2 domain-containing protein [Bacillus safensis]|uniref:PLAT/LH2 domain-containing protein n=1 Tax=Bacillus safensis TaxID=561879 RepID=UPI0018CF0C56|nr:PLAT/LH2 domain-containing protein [Bacillus safensis]MBG9815553.1 hypothetical protein [Bacillus safensis]
MQEYLVWIITHHREGAGSDMNLYLRFCGTVGKSKEIGPYTNFEAGTRKSVKFSTFESLGDITQCYVRFVKTPNTTDSIWNGHIHVVPLSDYKEHPGWVFIFPWTVNCDDNCSAQHFTLKRVAGISEKEEDVPKSICD